ncbi:MAG: spore maturation protein [Candidatus Sumerlaeia bacterium]
MTAPASTALLAGVGFYDVVGLISNWIIPLVITVICAVAYVRGVKLYEAFVKGAKEGFNIVVMIIPYLVAILFVIGVFRAGGAMKVFTALAEPLLNILKIPAGVVPMMFIRPLSGGGAQGVMVDIFNTFGVDSLEGFIASVMMGSTETTFYVVAVYFGSVGVSRIRYTLGPCLLADATGLISAVYIGRAFYKILGG